MIGETRRKVNGGRGRDEKIMVDKRGLVPYNIKATN